MGGRNPPKNHDLVFYDCEIYELYQHVIAIETYIPQKKRPTVVKNAMMERTLMKLKSVKTSNIVLLIL